MKHRCPTCGQEVEISLSPEGRPKRGRYFPFCGQRCQLADLNAWLESEYRIAEPAVESELDGPAEGDGETADK